MKNTICAGGGRVYVEPVAGGDAVMLSVLTDAGVVACVLLDEGSGGAVLFAIENSLELAELQRGRASTVNAERAAVRSVAP